MVYSDNYKLSLLKGVPDPKYTTFVAPSAYRLYQSNLALGLVYHAKAKSGTCFLKDKNCDCFHRVTVKIICIKIMDDCKLRPYLHYSTTCLFIVAALSLVSTFTLLGHVA